MWLAQLLTLQDEAGTKGCVPEQSHTACVVVLIRAPHEMEGWRTTTAEGERGSGRAEERGERHTRSSPPTRVLRWQDTGVSRRASY